MTELSPRARALLEAAKAAESPTAADRARVLAGIEGTLASSASQTSVGTSSSGLPAASSLLGLKAFVALLVVGGVGIGGYLLTRDDTSRSSSSSRAPEPKAKQRVAERPALVEPEVSPREPEPARPDSELARPEPVVQRPVVKDKKKSAPAENQASPPSNPAEDLARERALIRRAQKLLRDGAAAEALLVLDEHARDFPRGILLPERLAAQALSLCEVGRIEEAHKARDRFLMDYPASPLSERVRGACRD